MNILVPDHIPAEIRARWAALDPAVNIVPLGIHVREPLPRRAARAAAARLLPHRLYEAMYPLYMPRRQHSFSIQGRPLEAPLPEIDVCLATWLIGRGIFHKLRPYLPNLCWIHSTKTGVDHLLAPEFQRPGMLLTCSRGLHSERIAEFVTGLVFCFAKRLLEHQQLQQRGRFEEISSRDLNGKTVCVIGTGSIGQAVARRLAPLGMRVVGVNRSGHAAEGFSTTAAIADLHALLPQAQFVVLATPLTPETRELLGARELAALPTGASLINVARDELVAEAPLLAELRSGRLRAALEITRNGGLTPNHPLNQLPNVLITHYSAWSGETANAEIFDRFGRNILHHLHHEPLEGQIDIARGY
jgi:phosphoglycerate dehydrogenase-like enzyme